MSHNGSTCILRYRLVPKTPVAGSRGRPKGQALIDVHARLFPEDVDLLKQIAEKSRLSWQIELRMLIHRALRGEKREIVILEEPK